MDMEAMYGELKDNGKHTVNFREFANKDVIKNLREMTKSLGAGCDMTR